VIVVDEPNLGSPVGGTGDTLFATERLTEDDG